MSGQYRHVGKSLGELSSLYVCDTGTESTKMVKFTPESIDYSLYLVTGRELLPPGKVRRVPLTKCREKTELTWYDFL